jgi:hypothetical protein
MTPRAATWYDGSTNRLSNASYNQPDVTGNVTMMGATTLTYDGENQVKTAMLNGTTTQCWYGRDGRRVNTQLGAGQATIYV